MPSIRLPSQLESLQRLNALLDVVAAEAGLTEEQAYRLRLAGEELLVNVVRHGYGPERDGEIMITTEITKHTVELRLVDRAPRFDPFDVPDPVGLDQPLSERTAGALGLYLVKQSVDRSTHAYVDGANVTTVAIER